MNLEALGVGRATTVRIDSPDLAFVEAPLHQDYLTLPELGLWTVLELKHK